MGDDNVKSEKEEIRAKALIFYGTASSVRDRATGHGAETFGLISEQQEVLSIAEGPRRVSFTGSVGQSALEFAFVMSDRYLTSERSCEIKNVLVLTFNAQAGEVIRVLRKREAHRKAIATTASTLAACNIGSAILHSFTGIDLGKRLAEELVINIKRNLKAKQLWTRIKVLVVGING